MGAKMQVLPTKYFSRGISYPPAAFCDGLSSHHRLHGVFADYAYLKPCLQSTVYNNICNYIVKKYIDVA